MKKIKVKEIKSKVKEIKVKKLESKISENLNDDSSDFRQRRNNSGASILISNSDLVQRNNTRTSNNQIQQRTDNAPTQLYDSPRNQQRQSYADYSPAQATSSQRVIGNASTLIQQERQILRRDNTQSPIFREQGQGNLITRPSEDRKYVASENGLNAKRKRVD